MAGKDDITWYTPFLSVKEGRTVTDSEQRGWVGNINHDGQERKGSGTGILTVQLSESSDNKPGTGQ